MDGSCSDDSGIAEERAGGGPGPTGEGTEQEDRRRNRGDEGKPAYWQSTHLSADGGEHSVCERPLHV